jgi:hypothetical protein
MRPMRVLETISIASGGRRNTIELCSGDLTNVPPEHSVDVLVVSAFPDDYAASQGSLIGALARRGVSVAALARRKEVDLRQAFSCWLSPELTGRPAGVPYKRILCFEPAFRGSPPQVVGDVFRALAPFLAGTPPLHSVAMPILAAGDQGYTVENMLEPLLEAAVTWMRTGMPLSLLKIVATEQTAERAKAVFGASKKTHESGTPLTARRLDFDVFLSYAREDSEPADVLASTFKALSLKVFLDRLQLAEGSAWQPRIFEAIDRCRRLIALYSPAYVQSKVCQEEFNIAWALGRKTGADIVFPVYWCSAELPTYMTMLTYADCRERQLESLAAVAKRVADACG